MTKKIFIIDPRGRKPKNMLPINASFDEVLDIIGHSKKQTRRERRIFL